MVIDVTSMFEDDVQSISGLSASQRTQFKVRRLDPQRSYIEQVKSFPMNVEVRQVQTFDAAEPPALGATSTLSLQVAQSIVLLPREPMRPRHRRPAGGLVLDQPDRLLIARPQGRHADTAAALAAGTEGSGCVRPR